MTVHCSGWREEQMGFRVTVKPPSGGLFSDIFELEGAARECFQRLRELGWNVTAAELLREVVDGEVVDESERPVEWAA